MVAAGRKAVIQIRAGCGELFYIFGMDGKHNAFVDTVIDLSQLVAFILIDDEQISGSDGIKTIID